MLAYSLHLVTALSKVGVLFTYTKIHALYFVSPLVRVMVAQWGGKGHGCTGGYGKFHIGKFHALYYIKKNAYKKDISNGTILY